MDRVTKCWLGTRRKRDPGAAFKEVSAGTPGDRGRRGRADVATAEDNHRRHHEMAEQHMVEKQIGARNGKRTRDYFITTVLKGVKWSTAHKRSKEEGS